MHHPSLGCPLRWHLAWQSCGSTGLGAWGDGSRGRRGSGAAPPALRSSARAVISLRFIEKAWVWKDNVSWGHANHPGLLKTFSPSPAVTHLRGAQALPTAGAEHEALFAGDGALHVPRAIRGAVHAGGVSNRGLRTASQPCTGTVGTATEKKRDGVSQQAPGVVQQGAALQVAPAWDAQQATDGYRDVCPSLSHCFF